MGPVIRANYSENTPLLWIITCSLGLLPIAALFFTEFLYILGGFIVFLCIISTTSLFIRLALLIALLPFAHAGIGIDALPGFGFYNIYAGFFVLLFVFGYVYRDLFSPPDFPVLWMGIVMLIFFIPSVLTSVDYGETIKSFVHFSVNLLTAAGIYWILVHRGKSRYIIHLLSIFIGVVTIVSAYVLYRSVIGASLFTVLHGRAYLEMFGNVNFYSSYLMITLAISFPLMFMHTTLVPKLYYIVCSLIIAIGVFATVSRSALLGFVVLMGSVLVFLFVYQQGSRRYISVFVVLIVISVISLFVFTDIGGEVVDSYTVAARVESVAAGYDKSAAQRLNIYKVAFDLVQDNIITGVGFGGFESAFWAYQGPLLSTGFDRASHNTAIEILAETGIIGFIPSMIFIFLLLRFLFFGVLRAVDYNERIIAFAFFIAVTIFLIMSLFINLLYEPHFWTVAAIGIAYNSIRQRTERSAS